MRMSAVSNERTKLTAGLLNTIAGFALTAGGIGPLIAVSYGISAAPSLGTGLLVLIVAIWMSVGIGLNMYARRVLGGLKA